MNKKIFLLIMMVQVGIYACDSNRIYESNVKIPAGGWQYTERARFEVDIADTISPCNIYINIRNNNRYKSMDFWMFVDVYSPAGLMQRDTVKIMLADHRGKWLGHGLGDKFDVRMVFQKNVRFPAAGKYVFEYEHAMRDELLVGIEDIGLRIEAQKP